MELRNVFKVGAFGLLLAAAGGCYEYPPPPAATMGDTYTQRKQDGADRLLDDITDLTLADAQRIAIRNNPTYIAAYHAVNAARMRYLQAWGAYSPTVSASFSLGDKQTWTRNTVNTTGTPNYTEGISTSTAINVNWLVFDGLAREFSVLIYRHNFDYQKMLEEDEARTMMRARRLCLQYGSAGYRKQAHRRRGPRLPEVEPARYAAQVSGRCGSALRRAELRNPDELGRDEPDQRRLPVRNGDLCARGPDGLPGRNFPEGAEVSVRLQDELQRPAVGRCLSRYGAGEPAGSEGLPRTARSR